MKKIIGILFILVFAFTLVACGGASLTTVLNSVDIDYAEGDSVSSVTTHLDLPTVSDKNKKAEITWQSDQPSIIDNFGTVNRPEVTTDVKLTVAVTLDKNTETRQFYVTVLGLYNDVTVQFKVLDEIYQTVTVKAGTYISAFANPVVAGYTFNGWFVSPENTKAFSFTDVIRGSMVVEARMTELQMTTYTLEIYHQNITDELYTLASTENIQAISGTTFVYPTQPVGFTLNTELSSQAIPIPATITTYKVYFDRQSYVVKFMSDGVEIGTQNLKYGELVTTPNDIIKESHILDGWAVNSAGTVVFNDQTLITENITLYAVWSYDSEYTGYYASISGVTDTYLKSALRTLITQMTLKNYGEARYILNISDRDPNNANNVILVYNRASVSGTWDAGITWSREHVWPQSMLGASAVNTTANIASDLQNLKPINQRVNEDRSNLPFSPGSGTHGFVTGGYYPGDADKGDIARILFYMHVRWNLIIGRSTVGDINLLLQWHLEDPVDDFERNRNEVIFNAQKNRNPFIDHPEFAERIWGPVVAQTSTNDQVGLNLSTSMPKITVVITYEINYSELKKQTYVM